MAIFPDFLASTILLPFVHLHHRHKKEPTLCKCKSPPPSPLSTCLIHLSFGTCDGWEKSNKTKCKIQLYKFTGYTDHEKNPKMIQKCKMNCQEKGWHWTGSLQPTEVPSRRQSLQFASLDVREKSHRLVWWHEWQVHFGILWPGNLKAHLASEVSAKAQISHPFQGSFVSAVSPFKWRRQQRATCWRLPTLHPEKSCLL